MYRTYITANTFIYRKAHPVKYYRVMQKRSTIVIGLLSSCHGWCFASLSIRYLVVL